MGLLTTNGSSRSIAIVVWMTVRMTVSIISVISRNVDPLSATYKRSMISPKSFTHISTYKRQTTLKNNYEFNEFQVQVTV